MGAKRDERHAVLARQLEYEQQRAFEQYNDVDPRNRLVAAELERRWNAKLEEGGRLKAEMDRLSAEAQELTEEEVQQLLSLSRRFPEVWNSEAATPALKRRIVRTVIEEIVLNLDDETEKLTFTVHWKGGTHTQFTMAKPVSGSEQKTAMEDIEIIGKMGVRYGDDEIARVLNKFGRTTGRGNRWE